MESNSEFAVVKKIREAQKSIRQKTLALKIGKNEMEKDIDFYLKPISTPLEKLARLQDKKQSKDDLVKKRLLDEAHDVLASAKRQRQRVEQFSPKSSQKGEELRNERIKKIMNSPKLKLNLSKTPLTTLEWDPKFDFNNLKTPVDTSPIEFSNSPIFTPEPTTSSSGIDKKSNSSIADGEEFKESLPDEKGKETPSKRESLSNLDYYKNLLNIRDEKIDKSSGINFRNNRYELNRVPIKLVDTPFKALEINGQRFRLTRGLNELLFMKQPDQKYVSNIDERNYKKIALEAMFKGDKKLSTIKTKQYLGGQGGLGLFMNENNKSKDYVYWDNPNELVTRLEILYASKSAGHSGHDNEIIALEEELRERNYIE
uniref:DUF8207 domain-containing protein n=1 Tax=Cacopsylla melanoneura TaxID=428564 RepID=A0A8D8T1F1_9HEMI